MRTSNSNILCTLLRQLQYAVAGNDRFMPQLFILPSPAIACGLLAVAQAEEPVPDVQSKIALTDKSAGIQTTCSKIKEISVEIEAALIKIKTTQTEIGAKAVQITSTLSTRLFFSHKARNGRGEPPVRASLADESRAIRTPVQ